MPTGMATNSHAQTKEKKKIRAVCTSSKKFLQCK